MRADAAEEDDPVPGMAEGNDELDLLDRGAERHAEGSSFDPYGLHPRHLSSFSCADVSNWAVKFAWHRR